MAKSSLKELLDYFAKDGGSTVNATRKSYGSGKTVWTFGRSSECDFVYTMPKISRKHCQIELVDSHYYLSDCGSTNGTYLNGMKIERTERLFPGDVISISSVDIVFTKDMLY